MDTLEFHQFLQDRDNAIDFGLYMLSRQTPEEQELGITVELNEIGFNSPDSQKLTPMLIAIRDAFENPQMKGWQFSNKDLNAFYSRFLLPSLDKYHVQWQVYMQEVES